MIHCRTGSGPGTRTNHAGLRAHAEYTTSIVLSITGPVVVKIRARRQYPDVLPEPPLGLPVSHGLAAGTGQLHAWGSMDGPRALVMNASAAVASNYQLVMNWQLVLAMNALAAVASNWQLAMNLAVAVASNWLFLLAINWSVSLALKLHYGLLPSGSILRR